MSKELTYRTAAEGLDKIALEEAEAGRHQSALDAVTLAFAFEKRHQQIEASDFGKRCIMTVKTTRGQYFVDESGMRIQLPMLPLNLEWKICTEGRFLGARHDNERCYSTIVGTSKAGKSRVSGPHYFITAPSSIAMPTAGDPR